MQVTERMQALGDHAKSSRQPPLKERKSAKTDASAAKPDPINESILENGGTHESAAAVLADDVTPQIVVHKSGNGAVAEITSRRRRGVLATAVSVAVEIEADGTPLIKARCRQERPRKTTTTAPQNAPSFTSGKIGRRYIRMSWGTRMSRNIFSGICR